MTADPANFTRRLYCSKLRFIFLSFITKKLILMTFLIFFGFSSLAMSVSDIYFFIVILLKMRNNELFYQEDNKIYIFKK